MQLDFLRRILLRSVLFSHISSRPCSLVTFSDHSILSILLQHHISKISKYFRSNSLSDQVSSHIKQSSKHNTNQFHPEFNLISIIFSWYMLIWQWKFSSWVPLCKHQPFLNTAIQNRIRTITLLTQKYEMYLQKNTRRRVNFTAIYKVDYHLQISSWVIFCGHFIFSILL